MNVDLMKTLCAIEKNINLDCIPALADLHKAYGMTMRLRSQLLGVIYDNETFGAAGYSQKISANLSDGLVRDGKVTLTIHEPLPPIKELTAAVQDHWLALIHTDIGKAAQKRELPFFEKAFAWIRVVTPRGTNNANLWDTSNRAVNLIINNLKGIFFKDDNIAHMGFGVIGEWGEKGVTIIHISSYDELLRGLDVAGCQFPMSFKKHHGACSGSK